MGKAIDIFFITCNDSGWGETLALDLRVHDQRATLADFLTALDEFAAERLESCRGCDLCCRERAPLIAADLAALAALLPPTGFPAHAVCAACAELSVDQRGASDLTLRREQDGGACHFLDQERRCCTVWPSRPFVCRSHFCLPRSPRFHQLRQEVVNLGENELTRLLLAEEEAGAPPLGALPLAQLAAAADYPANALSGCASYDQIRLADCLSPQLWQELMAERDAV